MRRLLALIWLAMSLAFASGPAFAMSAASCPMTATSQSSAMHHDGKDCCKPACAPSCTTACPAAVEPSLNQSGGPVGLVRMQLLAWGVTPLHSTDLSGADPPPRTTFS